MRSRTSTSPRPTRSGSNASADRGGQNGRPSPPAGPPPRLADGLELIGKYEGSGFKEEPYLVRRADGQVIQLPELLYLVAEQIDGTRDYAGIGERVSERFGRGLETDDARMLVEEKLRPLGVLAGSDVSDDVATSQPQTADPMLALRFKVAVIPPHVVRAITTIFRPLFLPAVVLAVIGGLITVDIWLFFMHGVAGSVRQVLYQPLLVVLILGLLTLSAAFHEIGHATACRYGEANPGAMGAGIYVVWPAFYTDVTDAYRLDRRGRLRTDLGGIYFNAIFILATVGAYFLTGYEPLLLLIPVQHFQILFQLMPMLRLDGYYVISDLTGVPDMLGRIKPILRSLLPWRKTEPAVTELKPWARAVVTLYVLITVPALVLGFGLMLLNLPRIAATGYDSFFVQLDRVRHTGSGLSTGVGALQLVILVLPVLGMGLTTTRVTRKVGGAAWAATEGRPALRTSLLAGAGSLLGFLAFTWWPNGEYRPIQPGERGTIQGGIAQLTAVSTGRPGLTRERRAELKNAPTVRSHKSPQNRHPQPAAPATTSRTTTEVTPTTTAARPTTPAEPTTTPTPTSTALAPGQTESTDTNTATTETTQTTEATQTETTPAQTTPTTQTTQTTQATQTTQTATTETRTSSVESQIAVPAVVGQDEATARAQLQRAGLAAIVQYVAVTDPSQEGIVVRESPGGGTQAPRGSQVTLYVGRAGG
jgi:putative peptide zinc metalloprotease protein